MQDRPSPTPPVRSFVAVDAPGVVVSVPCPACAGDDPACQHCRGDGIELWRVAPGDASLTPDELRARLGTPEV